MKQLHIYALALACSGISLSATDISTNIIVDGDFEAAAGGPWDYGNHWRDNGNGAVFDALNTNITPSWSLLGQNVDLTTNTVITSDTDYDANTTLLTGFDTNSATFDAFLPEWAEGRLNPANADYQIFWEIDVSTAGSNYRLKSNSIAADELFATGGTTIVNGGDEFNSWAWNTGGAWAGDLTAASNVTIASITNMTAKLVIYAGDTDETQTETAFWIVDNMSINANVSTVPEPASFALLAGMLAFASIAVRRRK